MLSDDRFKSTPLYNNHKIIIFSWISNLAQNIEFYILMLILNHTF